MTIPANLLALINQLNQELVQIEQEATEGVNMARVALSRFPNNDILIQLFASLNNFLLFVDISRRQIEATVEDISSTDVSTQVIQEAGETLATLLGRVIEVKIVVNRAINRLDNFQ